MNSSKTWSPSHFRINYEKTSTSLKINEHFHNSYEIIFVTCGESEFKINNKRYLAKPNSIIFINNFESHNTEIKNFPYERYFMLISQEFLRFFLNDPVLVSILKQRPDTFKHLIDITGCEHKIVALIDKIYKEYNENNEYSYTVIGNYLSILLIILYRNFKNEFPTKIQNNTHKLVNNVQKYIEQNYFDNLTLAKTADIFHIDKYYLSHIFKKITGFTFKDYLIFQRLSAAKELLINSDKNITRVCIDSGFNNVNHFIRIFKSKEGLTPLKFRSNYSKN